MASGLPPAGNPDFLDALLHGMGPDHLQQLDELLGLSAPQPDQTQEQAPQQGLGSQVLGSFSGLENQPAPNPQDFGTSFAAGLSRGLGSAGSRAQAQRAKLESDIASRARIRAAANLQATRDYQQAHEAGVRGIVMAGLQDQLAGNRAKEKAAEDARAADAKYKQTRTDTLNDRAALNAEWDRRFTKEQAATAAKTKTAAAKPPNEWQAKAQFFSTRADEASKLATEGGLESRVLNKAWSLQAPPALQGDKDVRAYWRAMEAFGLALNRLESGASIAPTEFARVRQLYFVAPGDKPEDIAAKSKLRDTIVKQLGAMQGPAAAPDAAAPEAAPMTTASPAASLWEPD